MVDRRDFLKCVLLASAGLAAFPLVGCSGSDDDSAPAPVDGGPRTLRIGAVLPLTGPWQTTGLDAKLALELALPGVNHYLQSWNQRLDLTVKDSGSTPEQALQALQALQASGIRVVIGPTTSQEVQGVLAYANAHQMLLVSPSSTAVSLAQPDNLYRFCPNDSTQVDALVKRFNAQGVLAILPVYLGDLYGRDFHQSLLERSASAGFELLAGIEFASAATDYADLATQIAARMAVAVAGNKGVLLIGRDVDGVGLLRAARALPALSTLGWYSTDGVIREQALLADPAAADFAATVQLEGFTFAVEDTIPVVPLMMASGVMTANSGALPSPSSLPAWDAIWLLAETLRQVDADNLSLFTEKFRAVTTDGANVFGQRTTLDANGDINAAKYARFVMRRDDSNAPFWRLEGMYIRNAAPGSVGFLTASTAYLTREAGAIKIGALLPLTGASGGDGIGAQKALDLALEHINGYFVAGQKLNLRISLDVRDTASDPATALTQVRALQAAGVQLMIGPFDSIELAAVADYARANQLMLISPTSSAPSLARSDDLIMRLSPDDTCQAKALVRLMRAQGKQSIAVIHRDDSYGRELAAAVQAQFAGAATLMPYAVGTTDFRALLSQAAQALAATAQPQSFGVLAIGFSEMITLLEQADDGPLTSVDWYGSDGFSRNRQLLSSPQAVATAAKVRLTCSVFDAEASGFFYTPLKIVEDYLSERLQGLPGWNELATYDALWLAATAYAMSSPQANSQTLWHTLNNPYGATGVGGGNYVFNQNQDQSLSLYGFYTVTVKGTVPAWQVTAYYRDVLSRPDDLQLLPIG